MREREKNLESNKGKEIEMNAEGLQKKLILNSKRLLYGKKRILKARKKERKEVSIYPSKYSQYNIK